MSDSFSLNYFWRERAEPREYDFEEFPDTSVLYRCLRLFSSRFEGELVVRVNDLAPSFNLDLDLSTTFEYLPDVLLGVTEETPSPVWLDFFEQGTDLAFRLERRGNTIEFTFSKGDYVSVRFKDLPEDTYQIDAGTFLSEWVGFARAILAALVPLRPELSEDEEYLSYLRKLERLEEAAPPRRAA